MTRTLRTAQLLTAAWLLLLGGCAAVAVWVPPGAGRTAFGDIFQCLLPLLVNGALLMNAITPNRRKNAFWMLLALGCSLGLGGQVIWTYVEVYQHWLVCIRVAVKQRAISDCYVFGIPVPRRPGTSKCASYHEGLVEV